MQMCGTLLGEVLWELFIFVFLLLYMVLDRVYRAQEACDTQKAKIYVISEKKFKVEVRKYKPKAF